ncbi:hypothetical protein SGRIM128S_06997 [Streptomyces griseomycini]
MQLPGKLAIPDAISPLARSTTASRNSTAVISSQVEEAVDARRASIGRVGFSAAVSNRLSARPPVRGGADGGARARSRMHCS